MPRGSKVAASKKIKKAPKDNSASKKKSPVKDKASASKDPVADTTTTVAAPDTTTTAPASAPASATKKSPVRRTRTMAETVKEGKKIIKAVRGGKARKSSAAATKKRADANKKAAKPAADKPKVVKKVEASKKIKRTRTMAAVISDGKKITKNLGKRGGNKKK